MLGVTSKTYQQETGFKILQETLKQGMGGMDSLPSSGPACGTATIKDP